MRPGVASFPLTYQALEHQLERAHNGGWLLLCDKDATLLDLQGEEKFESFWAREHAARTYSNKLSCRVWHESHAIDNFDFEGNAVSHHENDRATKRTCHNPNATSHLVYSMALRWELMSLRLQPPLQPVTAH